jgi:8-hydroxy-5-deazaflavin:NADPH oxidoreductase
MTQTIRILGSGLVGNAVAHLAVAAGYKIAISNSRGPESLAKLVSELGSLARSGTVEEAIAAGDIVAIALPLATFAALPADRLAGKVVLDQTNYYPGMGDFRRADLDNGELTSSELMQKHLRGAKVVKGLHNLSWIHMEENARPKGDPERTTLPIAGDDAAAKKAVTNFLEAVGYDVVDAQTALDPYPFGGLFESVSTSVGDHTCRLDVDLADVVAAESAVGRLKLVKSAFITPVPSRTRTRKPRVRQSVTATGSSSRPTHPQ